MAAREDQTELLSSIKVPTLIVVGKEDPITPLEDILLQGHPVELHRPWPRVVVPARTWTQAIMGLSQAIVERFGGEVPGRLVDLVTLPGVGRKTANVVLGNAFDVPGLTVDTHFARLARRFGWTANTDAVKIESDVAALIPKREWTILSHRLIWHGRRCCHSRRPACGACPLARLCPSYGEGPTDPEVAAKLLRGPE